MKKWFVLLIACLLTLAACGNSNSDDQSEDKKSSDSSTVDYQLDNGKTIEIPKNPKRIVLMGASYTGNLLDLGIKPVGVDSYAFQSDILKPELEGVEQLGAGDVEKIVELKPDLILSFDTDKNNDKYSKIAPTIPFTYTKHNYLDIHKELGKIVNKEKEAQAFIDQWNEKTADDSKEIKAQIGEDTTVSIYQIFQKKIYVYGDNWGRGSEIIYQAFDLAMPESVTKDVKPTGWKEISAEEIGKYAGDIMMISSDTGKISNSIVESKVWKNLDAVKNNRVINYDSEDFWFNDPISLEHQREVLKKELMKIEK